MDLHVLQSVGDVKALKENDKAAASAGKKNASHLHLSICNGHGKADHYSCSGEQGSIHTCAPLSVSICFTVVSLSHHLHNVFEAAGEQLQLADVAVDAELPRLLQVEDKIDDDRL